MPIVASKYKKKPWYFFNCHWETVVPSLFYKIKDVVYDRERLDLDDGDFLDLDWIRNGNNRLMILSHGLEGNSTRHYIQRPAKFFSARHWDILAWNNRSCSDEMNRLPRFYHHGATEDIAAVIDHGLAQGYEQVVLMGYSMGGGMQQKYLGERKTDLRIKGAVSFSVPCNIADSAAQLGLPKNRFYEKRFIKKLNRKVLAKSKIMEIGINGIENVKTFRDFDKKFTLVFFPGFKDTDDFYRKITSDQYLSEVQVPLLIVNAKNDPMLGEKCYPLKLADKNKLIYLETPEKGGHIGFTMPGKKYSYMEYRAESFIDQVILGEYPRINPWETS